MSALIDRIRARHHDRLTRIEVPEWGEEDTPLVIYATPYTIADDKAIARFLRDDDPEGFLEIVIRKAMDGNGERLFSLEDRPVLKRTADAAVVKRVAMRIMAGVTREEAEKN